MVLVGVVTVLRLRLWRLLVLASWTTYFLSLVILLGQVGLLLMVHSGCGTVLLTFLIKKPTWKLPLFGGVAALVAAAAVPPLVALRVDPWGQANSQTLEG